MKGSTGSTVSTLTSAFTSAATTPRGEARRTDNPDDQFCVQVEAELKRAFLENGGTPGAPASEELTEEQAALKERMQTATKYIATGCPVPFDKHGQSAT